MLVVRDWVIMATLGVHYIRMSLRHVIVCAVLSISTTDIVDNVGCEWGRLGQCVLVPTYISSTSCWDVRTSQLVRWELRELPNGSFRSQGVTVGCEENLRYNVVPHA